MAREWLLPIAGGLAAGFVAGMFGVGGGVLLVPVLVLLLHRSQHVAHATSLVAIVIPAIVGAGRFAVDDAVVWVAAAAIAVGALVGVQAGAALLHRVPERELRLLFAALLAVMVVRLLLAGAGDGTGLGLRAPDLDPGIIAAHVAVGLASGTASALFGIGGGAVIVPALVVLLGYGQHIAEGTSLAVIVPTALVGAATHARRGYTEWPVGWRLGLGGAVGALLGAQVALSLPGAVLSRAFAGLLAVVTALLLRRRPPAPQTPAPPTEADADADAADAAVVVRPITPDRHDDLLGFLGSALPEGHRWAGCYCYYDRYPGPGDDFDAADAGGNRRTMQHLLSAGLVRGWLAYDGDDPVGWCHAASRVELPHLKVDAPLPPAGTRVGVVACFLVAPSHRRRGVARRLLGAACDAFEDQGMSYVEAYPRKDSAEPDSFRGPLAVYRDAGFEVTDELESRLVVRRHLG